MFSDNRRKTYAGGENKTEIVNNTAVLGTIDVRANKKKIKKIKRQTFKVTSSHTHKQNLN